MVSLLEAKKLISDSDFPNAINSLAGTFTKYSIHSEIHEPPIPLVYARNVLAAATYTIKFDRHPKSQIFNVDFWNRSQAYQQTVLLKSTTEALKVSGMYYFEKISYAIPTGAKEYKEYWLNSPYSYGYAEIPFAPNIIIPSGYLYLPVPTYEKCIQVYNGTPFEKIKSMYYEREFNNIKLISFPIPCKAITSISFRILVAL